MDGLSFDSATPAVRSDPARADIACFVGFVNCRASTATQRGQLDRALRTLGWGPGGDPAATDPALPASPRVLPDRVLPGGNSVNAFAVWIEQLGWRPTARGVAATDLFARAAAVMLGSAVVEWWIEYAWVSSISSKSAADLLELADVPVPIDSWDQFDTLFAWDVRPTGSSISFDTTLGAAVRRFFLQGGRKCYVVRVADSWSPLTTDAVRGGMRARVLPSAPSPVPVDRSTWRGVGHLCGLPDVSFLCVPDLPDLFASESTAVPLEIEPVPDEEERFIECATPPETPAFRTPRASFAPRCDAAGFGRWSAFVTAIAAILQRYCREVQFVAAVPLPLDENAAATSPGLLPLAPAERRSAIASNVFNARVAQWQSVGTIQTAFVQLAYPWLRTRDSARMPGGVEPPDTLLAGVLANNALTHGSWRCAAHQVISNIVRLEPALSIAELSRELPFGGSVGMRRVPRTLRERVSVFGPTPIGVQLLSDVTTDDDDAYRPANVNRLVGVVVRAARITGEDVVFLNNGEDVWRRVQAALEDVLRGLWGEGALIGTFAGEAFEVRCDRSTMTQADLDAGRVITRVQFNAASPIEHIVVMFTMDEGGQVTLVEHDTAEVPA